VDHHEFIEAEATHAPVRLVKKLAGLSIERGERGWRRVD
jgi:hypothetical protein